MHVLIPVDDMPYTLAALNAVRQRSWPVGTRITLCRVVEDCQSYGSEAGGRTRRPTLTDDTEYHLDKARTWLQNLAAAIELENCEIETALLIGDVAEQLSTLANQFSIDFIVIGSHDRTPAERAWLGSVASSVAERVNCSMEIVRPRKLHHLLLKEQLDEHEVETIDYVPRKILLATDFSENSLAALEWLCKLGGSPNTSLTLLSVNPPLGKGVIDLKLSRGAHVDRVSQPRDEDLEVRLRDTASSIRQELRIRLSDCIVLNGDPAPTILTYAKNCEADTILLGAHGVTRDSDSPVGSVALEVINGSSCSVIAINASTWKNVSFDWISKT